MPNEHAKPIPPGLTCCPVCGEYRSSTLAHNLTWNEPLDASELDEVIELRCICDGILCRRCGMKMHRPISNYYDEQDNAIWHVPYFRGRLPCKKCLAQERPT
jgi:hypothetical protein